MRCWVTTATIGCMLLFGTAQACPTAALSETFSSGDLSRVLAAHSAIERAGAECSSEERLWAGRLTAVAHGVEAERMLGRGVSPAMVLTVVDRGLRYGRPWRLLRQRGELLMRIRDQQRRPDWAAASLAFQDAMNDLNDEEEDPAPASQRERERLISLAEQTRMAATRPVQSPLTRSGGPGGLDLLALRGFQIRPIAQPIHFVFDSTDFADLGRAAADALYDRMARENFPTIRLVGHTDMEGTNAYNLRLSRERADRVRRYLETRGYPAGRISTEGRGKEEPLIPAAENVYSPEEFAQILRRVVLVRP